MRIAVWDEPALDLFSRSAGEIAEHHAIVFSRSPRLPLRNQLVLGEIDVALLPTLSVFLDHELFDVLPAVAISSWNFPLLRLFLKRNLGEPVETIAIDPALAQEALVTKIILKEHYDVSPSFKPFTGNEAEELASGSDGILSLIGSDEALEHAVSGIDLGRDWFELTHYPMVWGLFVMRKGEASSEAVKVLRDIASYTEVHRDRWVEEGATPPALHSFHREGIRYRLDDLATAGLTTFQDYLYYNKAIEEMAPLPFFKIPGEEEDDDLTPLL